MVENYVNYIYFENRQFNKFWYPCPLKKKKKTCYDSNHGFFSLLDLRARS